MTLAAGIAMPLAAALFAVGAAGVLLRRSMLVVLMALEIMLNAVNITLVAAAASLADVTGQVIVFLSLAVAAAEVAVGLALVVAVYRRLGRTDVDDVSEMHG